MNGTRYPWVSKYACNSTPLMPGIWTSAITHERSSRRFDRKNSSADANVCTTYPRDLTRLSVVGRTDAASSMIASSGSFDKAAFPWTRGPGAHGDTVALTADCSTDWD